MWSELKLGIFGLIVEREDRVILNSVSFSVRSGELLILRGPNGSGKSTLLRTLAGLQKPTCGEIYFSDNDQLSAHDFHADQGALLAYLGHTDALRGSLTIFENLLFWCEIFRPELSTSIQARRRVIDDVVRKFSLGHFIGNLPYKCSHGQRRRAALARVSLSNRQIWLLDEPHNGLDVTAIKHLHEQIQAHRHAGGLVILASHRDWISTDAITFTL